MKKLILESFSQLLGNRRLFVLCIFLVISAISFMLYVALNVHPNELQLVSHYSAFGVTHFYRDQWYYLLAFGAFGLLVAVMHVVLAVKVLIVKGPTLAILFTWMSIAMIFFAWMTTYALLNVWSPS